MKVSIAGAAGRMGKELLLKAFADQSIGKCKLIGGIVSSNSPALNLDLGIIAGLDEIQIKATSDFENTAKHSDVTIDFINPESSLRHAKICAKLKKPFVCGTTGFSQAQLDELTLLAQQTQILWSPNMSLGINLLIKLAKQAASKFGEHVDISIHESHHRHKKDSPSGTALLLGKNIEEVNKSKIQYTSIRAGDIIGEHTVMLASLGERIELTHKASNRSIFAYGAFEAAYWLVNQKIGRLYTMADFLE